MLFIHFHVAAQAPTQCRYINRKQVETFAVSLLIYSMSVCFNHFGAMALIFQLTVFLVLLALPSSRATCVIKVNTRQYEPFMYQNGSGQYVDGIEFHLIQTIAKKLNMEVAFQSMPTELELLNPT